MGERMNEFFNFLGQQAARAEAMNREIMAYKAEYEHMSTAQLL